MRRLELSIELVPEALDGQQVVVAGRVLVDDIQLGDTFTSVEPMMLTEDRRQQPPSLMPVQLTVREIYAYGHRFNRIDPGMTARFVLEGVPAHLLSEMYKLGGESEAELVEMEAVKWPKRPTGRSSL